MNKEKLIKLIRQEKIQNYLYTTFFFVFFSVFVVFAIRPNIVTAFNLNRELQELRLENRELELDILKIVEYQSTVESYRDRLYLLDQALPSQPLIGQVIDQINRAAAVSGILVEEIKVSDIFLISDQEPSDVITYTVAFTTNADFTQLNSFIEALSSQRRVKSVSELSARRSSEDTKYSLAITIENYHL